MNNREPLRIGLQRFLRRAISLIFSKEGNAAPQATKSVSKKTLQESEKKYCELVKNIVEGILILDFTGQVLFANKAVATMLAFDTPDECIGKNIFDFIASEHKLQVVNDLSRVAKGEWGFLVTYKVHKKHGELFWIDVLGRDMTFEGTRATLVVVRDITERKQMEEEIRNARQTLEIRVKERTSELKQSLEKVERLMKETVGALSAAVEAKDPYTAGHQKRVAELACALAKEMGLSKEKIDGIHIAGIVHDIGKIHIPAEILTRPGTLSQAEINLIDMHSQYSYDILQGIEFPWPIAAIVLQHHEKIDGSGYPHGLSGDRILPEAKILTVADTVEAMATNRPYRVSIGLEGALEEISGKKGILYDPDVVTACLRLFNEKRFAFSKHI
jgi:PAS domain S-box-containing protein